MQHKLFSIILFSAIFLCTVTSCDDDYDDRWVREDFESLSSRISALEAQFAQMNANISSLQTLVTAVDAREYITNIKEIEGGYAITFANKGTINLYNGETPIISVAQHTDGKYYWTVQSGSNESTWLKVDGDMVCATGETGLTGAAGENAPTPQLKSGYELGNSYEQTAVYLSVDNGTTWKKVSGDKGDTGLTGATGATGANASTPILGVASDLVNDGYDLGSDYDSAAVYLSVDGGATWKKVSGKDGAAGTSGNLNYIEKDENDNVKIVLTNGTEFVVPYISELLSIEADQDSPNTFTVTSLLLEEGTGNVVDIRVESENADGTTILTRSANASRWNVESSIEGTELTIVAKPANTVILNETALLKVTISNSDGKILASGQTVFTNGLIAVATKDELKNALFDEAVSIIELEEDLSINEIVTQGNPLSIQSDKEINLNGKTLSCDVDGSSILNLANGNISFSNGTIKFANTYAEGNYADIVVGADNSSASDKSDDVISRATATFKNMKIEGCIYVSYGSKVEIIDSEINAECFGICTNANAAQESTEPVTITISGTKLTGETPVFVNIPATLIMDNCTVIGGWQGVMMRGGKAVIRNSTISLQESYAEPVEGVAGTAWQKDRRTGSSAWGSGNEVAIAGITMGNNVTNAYQYPTEVTLENTSVSGYDGYWAVYADATEKCTVKFTYDSSCRFNPTLDPEKSFKQGIGANNGYITVVDGTGAQNTY